MQQIYITYEYWMDGFEATEVFFLVNSTVDSCSLKRVLKNN